MLLLPAFQSRARVRGTWTIARGAARIQDRDRSESKVRACHASLQETASEAQLGGTCGRHLPTFSNQGAGAASLRGCVNARGTRLVVDVELLERIGRRRRIHPGFWSGIRLACEGDAEGSGPRVRN